MLLEHAFTTVGVPTESSNMLFVLMAMFTEEEIKLLLDNSADDFDFLVPTIFDGSSIGLEGAARMDQGWGSGSRPSGCRLEVMTHFAVSVEVVGWRRMENTWEGSLQSRFATPMRLSGHEDYR